MYKLRFLTVAALAVSQTFLAQQKFFKTPDSLKTKSLDYLVSRLDENEDNPILDSIYSNSYLSIAKAKKNWAEMASAYRVILHQSDKETWVTYSDSILNAATKSKDDSEIGNAYLTKGMIYYNEKQFSKALDNYILANSYIARTDDEYLINKTKFTIGQLKYSLGFYNDAIANLKDCAQYFRQESGKPYLTTLHTLALAYIHSGDLAMATTTNNLGISECIQLADTKMISYFTLNSGIIDYKQKQYKESIKKLLSVVPVLQKDKDFGNEAVASFYLGDSYWLLKDRHTAVNHFKIVDNIFETQKFLKPEFIEGYKHLIEFYKQTGDQIQEGKYRDQILKAMESLYQSDKILAVKISREYDFDSIKKSNDQFKKEIHDKNIFLIVSVIGVIVLSIILAIIVCRRIQRNKLLKQKFREVMIHKDKTPAPVLAIKKIVDGDLFIKEETVEQVTAKLQEFEKSKLYLDKDFTLNKLSDYVGCNTRYTSKIVLQSKNKKYIEYIDSLRITDILRKLKSETKYQNYTIKALTDEAGFKSPQKFREAFMNQTGLTPVYFVKELKKAAA